VHSPDNQFPSGPIGELPCVSLAQCKEVYGTKEEHFQLYGFQKTCPSNAVRCVQTTELPPPATLLPCRPLNDCSDVYGVVEEHFQQHGSQPACPQPNTIRCIDSEPTSQATPATSDAPALVQIIGPQPIYISYNNVVGPSVGGDHPHPAVVESNVVGTTNQEAQINQLLLSLKKKLKKILKTRL